jgi:hypothetical protein
LGTELHVLITDRQGIPYLLILTGAITHNIKATIKNIHCIIS